MFNTLIDYYLILLLSLLFFYLAGSLIVWISKIDLPTSYFSIFVRLFIGVIVFVMASSIIFTKGRTIMSGFFLIAVFSFIELKKQELLRNEYDSAKPFFPKYSLSTYLEITGVISIIYLFRYFISFKLSGIPLEVHGDYVFYAKVSTFLTKSGVESFAYDFLKPISTSSPYPYHYFELWLNGASSFIFNSVSLKHLLLVTFSILTFLMYLGFCSIIEHFKILKFYTKLLSFLFIFFSGFLFWGLDSIPFFAYAEVFTVNAFSYPKILIIYLFLILSVLFFLKHQNALGFLSLLCLPIVFVSTAPAIFTGISIYCIGCLFLNFSVSYRNLNVVVLIYTFLIAFYVGGFYLIFRTSNNDTHLGVANSVIGQIANWQYWKTLFNIIAGTVIQLIVLFFIPLLFLIFFAFKYNAAIIPLFKKYPVSLIFIFFCTGLASWALMHNMLDSVQLFSNLIIPVLHISIFLLLVYFLCRFNRSVGIKLCIFSFLFLCGFSNIRSILSYEKYHPAYINSVSEAVRFIEPQGAYIKSRIEYNSVFSKNPNFSILGKYLSFLDSEFHPINISVFDIPLNKNDRMFETEKIYIETSEFYQFVLNQKLNNTFKSVDQSQIDFLDANNIGYLIVSDTAVLSRKLTSRIKREIVDSNTGERFILLK